MQLCRVCWRVWTSDGLCQAHRDAAGEPKYPTPADLEYEAWRDGYRWENGHKVAVPPRAPR
jgi:hypothetical protein